MIKKPKYQNNRYPYKHNFSFYTDKMTLSPYRQSHFLCVKSYQENLIHSNDQPASKRKEVMHHSFPKSNTHAGTYLTHCLRK